MISTMMTRNAPATNRQALWIASIARIYRSFMAALSLYCAICRGRAIAARSCTVMTQYDRSTGRLLRQAIRRSFHVLNALDQLGLLFAVFLPHRLNRFLERFLVVDIDDLDARFLHLVLRGLLHRVPKLALLLLRFLGKLHDHRLIILRERVPDLLGEHQDFGDHQMPGERVVLGVAVMLPGGVGRI